MKRSCALIILTILTWYNYTQLSTYPIGWWAFRLSIINLLIVAVLWDWVQGRDRRVFWGGMLCLFLGAFGFYFSSDIIVNGYYQPEHCAISSRGRRLCEFINTANQHLGYAGPASIWGAGSLLFLYLGHKLTHDQTLSPRIPTTREVVTWLNLGR